jgi:hypothetical protein
MNKRNECNAGFGGGCIFKLSEVYCLNHENRTSFAFLILFVLDLPPFVLVDINLALWNVLLWALEK